MIKNYFWSMSKNKHPRVGIGVFVVRDGKFLLGKRKNAHGEGTWCLVGGHLEYGESWEDCVRREIAEEIGVKVKNIRFSGAVTSDIFNSAGTPRLSRRG